MSGIDMEVIWLIKTLGAAVLILALLVLALSFA